MTQPPSESGNVVDPEVLASRRARRAEVSEDATLELRLLERLFPYRRPEIQGF